MGKQQVMHVINSTTPSRCIGKSSTPPWIGLEAVKLICKKNRDLSKAKMSKDPEVDKKFRTLKNRIEYVIKQRALNYLRDICEYLHTNPKKFWTFLKTKTKKNSLPQILRYLQVIEAVTHEDKAKLLDGYFYSTFNFPYPK